MTPSLTPSIQSPASIDAAPFGKYLIHFLKDVAITGAFLMLVANGAGPLSLDRRRAR